MSTVQKACIPKKTPKTPDFPLLFRLDPFRQIIQIHPAVHFLLQGPLRGFFFFHQLLQFCVLRSSFPYGRLQLSQLFLQNGDVIFDGDMGRRVTLINSGEETGRELSTILQYSNLLNIYTLEGKHKFFTTGDAAMFEKIASQWLDEKNYVTQQIRLE